MKPKAVELAQIRECIVGRGSSLVQSDVPRDVLVLYIPVYAASTASSIGLAAQNQENWHGTFRQRVKMLK